MKLLKDILYGTGLTEVTGTTNLAISSIVFDSRKVTKGCLFVAVPGTRADGHDFIPGALAAGAAAIVCERLPEELPATATFARVKSAARALGVMAANFYDDPSAKLQVVAITGTNGKTTVATLLYELFRQLGHKCGLLSTVRVRINQESREATHTTPDPLQIQSYMAQMVQAGCKFCFMEASSHGIHQERMSGIHLSGGVFTNITHDHLDYHGTFDDYILAKKKLFDELPASAFALVNGDDRHGRTMLHHTKAKAHRFALQTEADFKAKILEKQFTGMLLRLDGEEIWTRLIGAFNASNLLAVYAVASLLKQDKWQVLTALSTLQPVEGRFQYVRSQTGISAIVDYAHTPDALKNVLETIADIRQGDEKIIAVYGCGGDRDREKRPVMARIGSLLADQVILTSDNPRTEDPEAILREMEAGVDKDSKGRTLTIPDRKQAIRAACQMARPGDILLIAGKGHEKYQEIKGTKHPFDDLALLKETFTELQR